MSSILEDLLETRETPHQPVRLPRRARRERAARAGAPPAEAAAPRRHPEQRSLFLEILDWMLVPLLLLWPLSVGVTFLIARSLADAPFDRALMDRIEVVAQQVRNTRGTVPPAVPELSADPEPDEAGPDPAQQYVQVIGADGELMVGDRRLPPPALYDFPETDKVKLRNENIDGRELRVGYVYVELSPGGDEGLVLVQIGEALDKRNRLANEIIKGVIFPQFVILPGAVLLVWFGLGRGLAPLKQLQQRIRERDPDDPSPIDPRGAPEEVGPLIDAFNDLLQRQSQSVRAQKRFIADAAHQIKTPLAGLQTQAELALSTDDPAEVRRSLEQVRRSSERSARMVNQLLAMARAEHAHEAPAFVPLDLASLAREVVEDWVPAALARGIDIGFDAPETPVPIEGHAVLLRELLSNLIDNALRYTPRGGSVSVRVAPHASIDADWIDDTWVDAADDGEPRHGRDHRGPRLEVVDTGPGIPPAERELVFERFYRVLGTQVDGSGLGLAIVREIAQQHGATVAVGPNPELADGRGARFTVAFPAA